MLRLEAMNEKPFTGMSEIEHGDWGRDAALCHCGSWASWWVEWITLRWVKLWLVLANGSNAMCGCVE